MHAVHAICHVMYVVVVRTRVHSEPCTHEYTVYTCTRNPSVHHTIRYDTIRWEQACLHSRQISIGGTLVFWYGRGLLTADYHGRVSCSDVHICTVRNRSWGRARGCFVRCVFCMRDALSQFSLFVQGGGTKFHSTIQDLPSK